MSWSTPQELAKASLELQETTKQAASFVVDFHAKKHGWEDWEHAQVRGMLSLDEPATFPDREWAGQSFNGSPG